MSDVISHRQMGVIWARCTLCGAAMGNDVGTTFSYFSSTAAAGRFLCSCCACKRSGHSASPASKRTQTRDVFAQASPNRLHKIACRIQDLLKEGPLTAAASDEALRAIRSMDLNEARAADMKQDEKCVVCLEEFQAGEKLGQLPRCGHLFHGGCIHEWMKSTSTCPICRCVHSASERGPCQEKVTTDIDRESAVEDGNVHVDPNQESVDIDSLLSNDSNLRQYADICRDMITDLLPKMLQLMSPEERQSVLDALQVSESSELHDRMTSVMDDPDEMRRRITSGPQIPPAVMELLMKYLGPVLEQMMSR